MKNIFSKTILASAVIVFAGCSDFLTEKNIASQSAEEFYATAAGYESLVSGAYNTLKSVYNSTNYYSLTQLGTDLTTHNNGNATNQLNQYTPDYLNDNGTVYNQWKALYEALKNVNAVIGRAGDVITKDQDPRDGMDKAIVEKHVAEAKFLRALYLFEIVKNWGQGPLILEEPTSASTESHLNSGAEFYAQILSDLGDVIASELPMKNAAADYGRVSKAAAYHLRSLVYLTRAYQSYADAKDFENALKDAEKVIKESGHSLLDDYALVHRQSNEENDEIIFNNRCCGALGLQLEPGLTEFVLDVVLLLGQAFELLLEICLEFLGDHVLQFRLVPVLENGLEIILVLLPQSGKYILPELLIEVQDVIES